MDCGKMKNAEIAKRKVEFLKVVVGIIFIISVFSLYYVGGKGDIETTLTTTTSTFVIRTPYPTWYYPQITIILIVFFVSAILGGLLFVGFGDDIENFIKRKSEQLKEAEA